MSKPKFTDISGFEYNTLVTFAEISEKNNPMGRFDCIPVYVSPTKEQPKQGATYLCTIHHSCFGRFY